MSFCLPNADYFRQSRSRNSTACSSEGGRLKPDIPFAYISRIGVKYALSDSDAGEETESAVIQAAVGGMAFINETRKMSRGRIHV